MNLCTKISCPIGISVGNSNQTHFRSWSGVMGNCPHIRHTWAKRGVGCMNLPITDREVKDVRFKQRSLRLLARVCSHFMYKLEKISIFFFARWQPCSFCWHDTGVPLSGGALLRARLLRAHQGQDPLSAGRHLLAASHQWQLAHLHYPWVGKHVNY